MNTSDPHSASNVQNSTNQQLEVIKIYPLDGKSMAKSQLWVAVIQIQYHPAKTLFLRDGQQHRPISIETALSLLSSENKQDLLNILKRVTKKGGAASGVRMNSINIIQNFLTSVANQSRNKNKALQQRFETIGSGRSIFADQDGVVNATLNSDATVQFLVEQAQLRNGKRIKASGTGPFSSEVRLEAAAKSMYIEGYSHTKNDRLAPLGRMSKLAHTDIKSEYRSTNGTDLNDLSAEELTYLLMRVHQIDLNHRNITAIAVGLSENIGLEIPPIQMTQTESHTVITNATSCEEIDFSYQ